jgi:outer membrane protein assembly factor BamB/predicted MPP superfamily phosphohydrolase
MRHFLTAFCLLLVLTTSAQQPFRFALVTDIHIGSGTSVEDLRRTIADLNKDSSLSFVLISGDITEFGSDEELALAKQLLDSIDKPWYIVPGNHDTNWSESGGNSFRKVFGAETFAFASHGFYFIGTNSGPNMRMGPGQIPKENITWMDSVLQHLPDTSMPLVYINHYPQDDGLNNWYETIDRLKKHNVQLILCGHGHTNKTYSFEGIPGVMGRSNLRAKATEGGYTLVTVHGNKAIFIEKSPVSQTVKQWTEQPLFRHGFSTDTSHYKRPVYQQTAGIKELWRVEDKADIGTPIILAGKLVIATNTSGLVYALESNNGKKAWRFATGGKIYSTPATANNRLVLASTDGIIYCLNAATGALHWKYETGKAIVASPLIVNNIVYIGSSDGHFRALQLNNGSLIWDYNQVKGFISSTPLYYAGNIYFGSWGNGFYALNALTGKEAWRWNNGASNRMFSPAACIPVAAKGTVYIVAPDRYMTALNATNGSVRWRQRLDSAWMRESMGLSQDSSLVYIKTMQGEVLGIATDSATYQQTWKANVQLGYELNPAVIKEVAGIVYIPTQSGTAYAVNRQTGQLRWKYKSSNCLINSITPAGNGKVIICTMDGVITCINVNDL